MLLTKITLIYKYHLKRSRLFLTKNKYFYRKKTLQRIQNSYLMFLRSPKHFKTGKQHIVFFNGLYYNELILTLPKFNLNKINKTILFNLLKVHTNFIPNNDIIIHKLIIEQPKLINF